MTACDEKMIILTQSYKSRMLWGAMVGIILKGRVTGKKRIVFYGTDKLIYIITEVSRHSFFTKLFVSTAEIFVKLGLFSKDFYFIK